MRITMAIKGMQQNMGILNALINGNKPATFKILHQTGQNIVDDAKANLQQHGSIAKGDLYNDIGIKDENEEKLEVVVGSNLFQATVVEFGRGEVFPITAKVLHWTNKHTGEDIFSKHAGPTQPRPFLQPAVTKHTAKFSDLYVEEIESIAMRSEE